MTKYSEILKKISKSIPLWGWTLILVVTGAFRSLFVAEMTFNGYGNLFSASIGSFVLLLALLGVAYAFLTRIGVRIIYSVGARLYFRNTAYVPDYNLRRLPLSYGDFCALGLMLSCVYNLFSVAFNLLTYAVPTAYYLWLFLGNLIRICIFVMGWFVIRADVSDWQVKRLFISLGIPTLFVLILCVLGGV